MKSYSSLPVCTSLQQVQFLLLLPGILRSVRYGTRELPSEQREEACQEVIVQTFLGFLRLCQRGLQEKGFASSLAGFALKRYRSGRRVSRHSSTSLWDEGQDLRRTLKKRARLPDCRNADVRIFRQPWKESLPVDGRTPVIDQVCFRLDFKIWYASLSPVRRQVVDRLSLGDSPAEVATQLKVSRARVSQIRRELQRDWERFNEESPSSGSSCDTPPKDVAVFRYPVDSLGRSRLVEASAVI